MGVLMRTPLLAILALLACTCSAAPVLGNTDAKAALVYNLSLYVDWPEKTGDVSFCVLTESSGLMQSFQGLLGKTVRGRPLVVWQKRPINDLSQCQVAYINGIESEVALDKVRELKRASVLTIATDATAGEEAVMHVGLENQRMYFDINLNAARLARLNVSSKLLRLARKVAGRE